ncbi:hypothetical protein EON83_29530 [bacterium]|nr:MAG: hypothetical protein EON83_29530 [bacterium]
MKRSLLLCAVLLLAPALQSVAFAQMQVHIPKAKIATPAQQRAIEQWAAVIRRGKTSKVMYQVAALIKQTERRVHAQNDSDGNNIVLRAALGHMHEAATFKAQGLKKRNKGLLNTGERAMRKVHNPLSTPCGSGNYNSKLFLEL